MSTDLYTGAIDWDAIYRRFHNPSQIARCVMQELGKTKDPVVFSGFRETASYLANELPVTFVDHAAFITAQARKESPALQEVCTGDITQLVASYTAPNVVIVCRISAYWDSIDYFERLAKSLLAFPRECVLIDFFDRDLVETGQRLGYKAGDDVGEWVFLDFRELKAKALSFSIAELNVSYSVDGHSISYEGRRAFFRKDELLNWWRSHLPGYDAVLGDPIMDQDPSFIIKLVRRKTD